MIVNFDLYQLALSVRLLEFSTWWSSNHLFNFVINIYGHYQFIITGGISLIFKSLICMKLKQSGWLQVDLATRHCFPVYWHGENRRVLRGHWFARKNGLDWLPLREDIAEQLELAYRCQVSWSEIVEAFYSIRGKKI